jgi:hypothetical protein
MRFLRTGLPFLLLLVVCPDVEAAPHVHGWSQPFGDGSSQLASSVVVDGSGNSYVVGYFTGSVDFGGGVLTSAGSNDIFIAKFDAGGNHIWSQRFGDTNNDVGNSVALDPLGNVIVAGWFAGTVDFGGGVLTSAGSDDIFIAKFDAAGNPIWSQNFGDASLDRGDDVAVDKLGNIVMAGHFQGSVDFGGGVLTSSGSTDIFVAAFDAGGTHLWSQRFGDT